MNILRKTLAEPEIVHFYLAGKFSVFRPFGMHSCLVYHKMLGGNRKYLKYIISHSYAKIFLAQDVKSILCEIQTLDSLLLHSDAL